MFDRETFIDVVINEHPITHNQYTENDTLCPMARVLEYSYQLSYEDIDRLADGEFVHEDGSPVDLSVYGPKYRYGDENEGDLLPDFGDMAEEAIGGVDDSAVRAFIAVYDDLVGLRLMIEEQERLRRRYKKERVREFWAPDPEGDETSKAQYQHLLAIRKEAAVWAWDHTIEMARSGEPVFQLPRWR